MHHFSSEAPLLTSSRAMLCALIKSTCRQTLFYDTFGADESQSFEVTAGWLLDKAKNVVLAPWRGYTL